MALRQEIETLLVSPTPIRPISPSRDEDNVTPRSLAEDDLYEIEGDDMDLGLEIFEILQGSHSFSSTEQMRPPSRNSNPLLKDREFHHTMPVDRDAMTSTLFFCGDVERSSLSDSRWGRSHQVQAVPA
mmetsp:Transcript_8089/g.19114  ORF Transcript_8089/g.19114 Transcript_8089/m.19114 type:complete len:128 (-) Transcript_8089:151-534(-)|eukprot:1530372-Rhodomonas_salina.5